MKLLWMLAICLMMSFCSTEETPENDELKAAELKSDLGPLAVEAVESERGTYSSYCSANRGEMCSNDCDCCESLQSCVCKKTKLGNKVCKCDDYYNDLRSFQKLILTCVKKNKVCEWRKGEKDEDCYPDNIRE